MKPISLPVAISMISISALQAMDIKCIAPADGVSRCVIVGPAALIHTAQLTAASNAGDAAGNLSDQIKTVLANTDAALRRGGSSLAQAVKLNVYVTQDAAALEVRNALAAAFPSAHKPSVSCVTTALPLPNALVAMDAVGFGNGALEGPNSAVTLGGRVGRAAAVLPAGPRVYVSGQAEKGDGSLADATTQTLASLSRTLDFLGLKKEDAVQMKCFLAPMAKCSEAEKAIEAFFGEKNAPPCAFVEWSSNLPIEIEMVVSGAGNAALAQGPSVEVRTPPGMTTPQIYSRLTIARHPSTIYTSGIYPGDGKAAPETQLRSLFRNLKQVLDASGSDWMHLVKATYFVSDDELSKWHNTVRPDYFSPRRPPAASKAKVIGVGLAGHGITMDFIAVPGDP